MRELPRVKDFSVKISMFIKVLLFQHHNFVIMKITKYGINSRVYSTYRSYGTRPL